MSEIFVDTIKNKAGSTSLDSDKLPDMYSGSAKAWTNVQQSSTQTHRLSLNFSSITDEAGGVTTVTYTSAFANDDYCTTYGIRDGGGENDSRMVNGSTDTGYYTTTSQRIYCGEHTTSQGGLSRNDADVLCLCLHGDLA